MATQEQEQGVNCVAGRPCLEGNGKTFSVRLKWGVNDVCEFLLAF